MTEFDWKDKAAGLVTAYLTVPDAQAALDYYQAAFGFEPGEAMGPDGKILHASMTYHGTHVIMFGPESAPWTKLKAPVTSGSEAPVGLYLYHPDVATLLKQAVAAGGELLMEPEDQFWGDRIARVKDPFGYEWTLATKVGEMDESKRPQFDRAWEEGSEGSEGS